MHRDRISATREKYEGPMETVIERKWDVAISAFLGTFCVLLFILAVLGRIGGFE